MIARIASRQHGVITRSQLLGVGVSGQSVKRWVRKGVLHRVYRGVYRVGHRAPSTEALYLAAVFACGDGAVLSGRAAAHLYSLTKGGSPPPEVTTVADRRVRGVVTHRVRQLAPAELTVYRGIPTTTVARTIVDLAAALDLEELGQACHQAEVLHHLTQPMVEAAMARRGRPRGAAKLKAIFHGDAPITLSRLEAAFLTQLTDAGLPRPQTNRRASGRYVDCRWPDRNITVELDGYRYHHSRHAWELDRRREREARARGDEFRRYTWGDVNEDRARMLRELRGLLGDRGRAASG